MKKVYVIVMSVLGAVIIALVSVCVHIYYQPSDNTPAAVTPPDNAIEIHLKYRNPKLGAINSIAWENSLLGSADETIVECFSLGGIVYVFGNTKSNDRDFNKSSVNDNASGVVTSSNNIDNASAVSNSAEETEFGFVAAFKEGVIKAIEYFTAPIECVAIGWDGFVAASDKLYKVSLNTCKIGVGIEYKSSVDDKAVKIISGIDNGSILCFTATTSLIGITYFVAHEFNDNSEKIYTTQISSDYSLEYLDCFVFSDKYVLAVNRLKSDGGYYCPAFIEFNRGDPVTHSVTLKGQQIPFKADSITPYSGGYFAIGAVDGNAVMLKIGADFTLISETSTDLACVSSSVTYCNNYYYVFINHRQNISSLYKYDSVFSEHTQIPVGSMLSCVIDVRVVNNSVLISGTNEGEVAVLDERGNAVVRLPIAASRAVVMKDYTLVLSTANQTSALTASSGGSDIYIIKLKADN